MERHATLVHTIWREPDVAWADRIPGGGRYPASKMASLAAKRPSPTGHVLREPRCIAILPRAAQISEEILRRREAVVVVLTAVLTLSSADWAESPPGINDLEIAHVAYTADRVDIRYAHLALGISKNPTVCTFADTMIRDRTAVNDRVLALLKALKTQPQNTVISQQLLAESDALVDELRQLSGRAFDQRYARNELSYHRTLNGLIEKTFIPRIQNPPLKALFQDALVIFKAHEQHAQKMVDELQG